MNLRNLLKQVAAASVAVGLASQSALACTGILLHAKDGSTIAARTMEFGIDLESDLVAVPAGTKLETLSLNPKEKGFDYEAKYGFVGANGFDMPVVVDGINSEGLYAGIFFFAGSAVLQDLTAENQDHAVSSEEFATWALSQFATVAEVEAALPDIAVVGTDIEALGGPAPVHYALTDATGASIVVEYAANGLTVHKNTVNAVTNNPTYDWHLTNLQNYIGLSVQNHEEMTVGSQVLKPFGQGTGMAGLPGDFTSPSRFVRAAAFANGALPSDTGAEAVFQAFHILNNFDIPKGAIREDGQTGEIYDYTMWTAASDLKNKVYYIKTYDGQAIESLDVMQVLDGLDAPKAIKLDHEFEIMDRTAKF
ncbi:linear amide C-N hydrolase [Marinibacterium sp. SX1]|uniref:linear amide C-N hydrolase n=1 Tax=Marinibacterium sp. SX1 TaxID=3388424 RepID=UPI003D183C9E